MADINEASMRFLVIQIGELAEFCLSLGAFQAIRTQNPNSHITLLTIDNHMKLGEKSGFFDEVWKDGQTSFLSLAGWRLIKQFCVFLFVGVYDLHQSRRTEWFFRLIGKNKPDWSGHVSWCSDPYAEQGQNELHILDQQKEQLQMTGIEEVPAPDVSFLKADISCFALPGNYALLFPVGASYDIIEEEKPSKAQEAMGTGVPPEGFVALAKRLAEKNITPVLLGSDKDIGVGETIMEQCKDCSIINLIGQAELSEIVEIARHGKIAIGNDTDLMWPVAMTQCSTIIFFPAMFNYQWVAPRGRDVRYITMENFSQLRQEELFRVIAELIALEGGIKVEPGEENLV